MKQFVKSLFAQVFLGLCLAASFVNADSRMYQQASFLLTLWHRWAIVLGLNGDMPIDQQRKECQDHKDSHVDCLRHNYYICCGLPV